MVRSLIRIGARHARPVTVMAAIIATGLLGAVRGFAAETSITLSQGANISVTATDALDHIAFDLAGKIWLMDVASKSAIAGKGKPLTTSGALHQRPAFSRDGRLVAYESVLSGHRQIFITDIHSNVTRQVTFGPYDHLAPAWSTANHRQLVMSSNRGGNFDIWEVDVDNLDLRQLTFAAGDERDPAWNDDGSRLAYVTRSAQGSSLYILTPGDKPRRVLQEREPIAAPTWRPGGGLLTYVRLGDDSSQLRMLLLSTPPITKPITRHEQVSPRAVHWINRGDFLYAADGKIRRRTLGLSIYADIPFSVTININRNERSARTAGVAGHDNRPVRGLNGSTEREDGRYIVAALGDLWEFQRQDQGELSLVRQLTNDAYVDAQPAFSPTGERLVFVSDRSGNPQLWAMDHASLDIRRLTRDVDVVGRPEWSPDGNSVVYLAADEEHGYRLHSVDMTSHRIQSLEATSHDRGKPVLVNDRWEIHAEPNARLGILNGADQQPVPLTWRPAVAGERYIVRAGRIFDGIGPEYTLHQEIVIENDLIVAVRPWSDTEPDTPVIDATTHTVIPGLIDLAVQQESINAERNGRKWLAAGVTTIRQTVSDFNLAVERLESWNSGRRIGPRLMLTVRPCRADSGQFDERLFEQIATHAAALNIVAIELCSDLTGEALADVFQRAHKLGLSIIATTPDVTIGADELHLPVLLSTEQRDAVLIMGMAGTGIPSRLVTASGRGGRIFDALSLSWQYRKIFTVAERRRFDASRYFARASAHIAPGVDPNRILGAGGRILLGSEAPLTPQGLGLHAEMRLLAARGIQPFQVLKMASLDAARTLGSGESLGIIRVGRQADLVILDGDPLANIAAAANIVGTIVEGRYFSRRDLTTPGLRGLKSRLSVEKLYNSARR